jgi:predicted transcriptional regulator
MQMGKITLEYQGYRESFKIFMKALEYAWKLKDEDTELIIYDFIGKVYFY